MKAFPFLLQVSLSLTVTFAQNKNFLMIGNSYTSANSLPLMIHSMLLEDETEGGVDLYSHLAGGNTLVRHYENTQVSGHKLNKYFITEPKDWTWVVLQDQSQTPGFYVDYQESWEEDILPAAINLDDLVESTGGTTIFYNTWGHRDGDRQTNPDTYPDFLTMNAKTHQGYKEYVKATTTSDRPTKLAPVGMAFEYIYRNLMDQDQDPLADGSDFKNLYAGDGRHPSLQGSYLAACVIYATITGENPQEVVYRPDSLDEATAIRLRVVAQTTMENEQGDDDDDDDDDDDACSDFSSIFLPECK